MGASSDPSPPPTDAAARQVARARLLATFAGDIVHDLSNQLSAAVGLIDQVMDRATPAERDDLAALLAGTRSGLAMLQALSAMVRRDPRDRQTISLADLARDVLALLGKRARAGHRPIELVVDAAAPAVRVVAADAMQAILTAILLAQDDAGAGELRLRVTGGRSAAGRPVGIVALHDRGDPAALRAGEHWWRQDPASLSARVGRLGLDLAHAGGELLVDGSAGRRRIALAWPAST